MSRWVPGESAALDASSFDAETVRPRLRVSRPEPEVIYRRPPPITLDDIRAIADACEAEARRIGLPV
jgi:hypothetical protein